MRKVLLALVAILLMASIGLSCAPPAEEPPPEEPPPEEPPPPPPPPPEVRCTIIKDNFGVPHVFAETIEDLAFGAGYAMAQDRLWQADVLRRAAKGRLAEYGLATIDEDAATRQLWYSEQELQQMWEDWDPGEGYEYFKPATQAYVDGINAYIQDALKDMSLMPVEYIGLGLVYLLEPFTVTDVVALTVLMGWRFGGTGGNEGDIYDALQALQAMHGASNGSLVWSDLFPLDDPGAPVTIPSEGGLVEYSSEPGTLDLPDNLEGLFEENAWKVQAELFESLGIPTKFGSNAVLISGDLSQSGNTLQLGGPQMGYSIPQIVYEIGLHGAGINAQGMAIPCAGPVILIGVSDYGAWTSTTGSSDVMDVRILTLNPENPLQYWHNDTWVDMETRVETIYGFKKQTSQNVTCYRSVYGPIISMNTTTLSAITLHTPFFKNEMAAEQGWNFFQRATNITEFEEAVRMVWPSHNFYWADKEGNIGYWHAGRFPVKPETADRRLPLKGDGTEEWVRITDPDEMPSCINPDQGWLTNWNNKPIAGWSYAESDIHWGEGHRVQVLMEAMEAFAALGDLTTDTLNTLNQIAGYHNTAGMSFVSNVTAVALASSNETLREAGSYLQAWATATPLPASYVDLVSPKWPDDPNPTYDHPGLTIFNRWYDKVVPKVFSEILPPDLIAQVKKYPSLLIRVFRQDDSLLYQGYPKGATLVTLIEDALREAVDELATEYGSSDMPTWLTPVRMQSYDVQGALPQAFEHPYMNRGTYNQIVEMLTAQNATSVIPPGQSGFMAFGIPPVPSPHAYDQVPLYASWTYKPMLFSMSAVEAVETSRKVLYKS